MVGLGHVQVFLLEDGEHLAGAQLPAGGVAGGFDQGAEFGVHGLGQQVAEALPHDEGRAPPCPTGC